MTVLLRWIEPVEPSRSEPRTRPLDWILGFGVAGVVGLGIAEKSGPTMPVTFGSGYELTMPAQAWQYAVWLLIAIGFGAFGGWIMSLGGRAEVTVRADGIGWQLGRGYWQFYAYANMQGCELVCANKGDFWRMRVLMKPKEPANLGSAFVLTIPKRVDVKRLREILQSAGVVTAGWR